MSRNIVFASPQPVPSAPDFPVPPRPISFLFQVSELRIDYQNQMPRTDGPPGNWLPPDSRDQFKITYGPVYRWNDGNVSPFLAAGHAPASIRQTLGQVREYSTVSAFIQQQTGRMLTVPFNVTEVNFNSQPYDWRTIGFFHQEVYPDGSNAQTGTRNMSLLEFTGEERLAAPGSSPWIGELLPTEYDYYQGPAPGATPPVSGGLSGRLSLILALLAFSCGQDLVERVLYHSFKRGVYQAHRCPTGRNIPERGVVVAVYPDPWSVTSTRHLAEFEGGVYGPIFP